MHPVACTLSKLLEEPPLATTLQGVHFISDIFLPLHVSALAGHLQVDTHNYARKLLHSQRIRCFVLLGLVYCICFVNTAVVYLICVCELSKLGQITSLLNVKTLKC
jgi:hypothetical protein